MRSADALSGLLWFRPPGRKVNVLKDDTFLVSYPRSGSVWTRFLIASVLYGHSPDFVRMNALLPDIYVASRRHLSRLASPRLMKSHEYFDPRYRRVIYLIRDPRDVIMSYHEFQKKRKIISENCPLESYVERFVEGGLDPFGTWQEHVGSWLGARSGRSDFLLVRYEDLKGTTESELRRIVDFIGLEANDVQLAMAAEQCSFAAMRKLERIQAKEGIIDRSRVDRPALRSGRAGGWREELAPALAARIADAFRPVMEDLGYLGGSVRRRSSSLGQPEPRIRQAGS